MKINNTPLNFIKPQPINKQSNSIKFNNSFDSVSFGAILKSPTITQEKPKEVDNHTIIDLAKIDRDKNEAFRNKLQNLVDIAPEYSLDDINMVYGNENQITDIYFTDDDNDTIIGYTLKSKDGTESTYKFRENGELEFLVINYSESGHIKFADKFYCFNRNLSNPVTILENLMCVDGKCYFENGIAPTYNFSATEHNCKLATRNLRKFLYE